MPYDEEEVLDLVTINDTVIGQVNRSDYHKSVHKPGFVRSVNLFLINSQGKLWIPRRSPTQRIKPNALDYSAGGHVSAGETYMQAVLREAEEELHIHIDPDKLIPIGKLSPAPPRDYYFCESFVYYSDNTPKFAADEFTSYEWLTPEEVLAKLDAGEDAKDSLRGVIGLLLDYQAQRKSD